MIFPQMKGTTLAGERLSLPADLGDGPAVLLVALAENRHQVASCWIPYVKQLEQLYDNLCTFEVFVLGRANLLARYLSTSRLRSAIPNPSARARAVPLYVDRGAFCQALGLPADAGVHVLLLDATREVVWKARGPVAPEKVQSLAKALADAHEQDDAEPAISSERGSVHGVHSLG